MVKSILGASCCVLPLLVLHRAGVILGLCPQWGWVAAGIAGTGTQPLCSHSCQQPREGSFVPRPFSPGTLPVLCGH